MLLYGVALKCYYPIVTLIASLSHRDPFILPLGDERLLALLAHDEFGRVDYSDHLMLIRAFNKYVSTLPRQKQQICRQYYMAAPSMKMIEGIHVQLTFELKRLKLIPENARIDDSELNLDSASWPMIQAAIVADCYPGIGVAKCQSRIKKIRTSTDPSAVLHPGSVLKRQLQGSRRHESLLKYGDNPEPLIDFMAFQELSQIDEGITLQTVTATTSVHVVLFSGSSRMEKVIIRDF
uniref:Uncharacterized protein n=1 Tax=Panagrolaimus sp. JU765 TaxID=591449 RepID=A0AC34QWB7_9BILA